MTTCGRVRAILEAVQVQSGPPPRARDGGSHGRRVRDMRRKRIEQRRRAVRARPHQDEPYGALDLLDPRDPEIVRAKRLPTARNGGTRCP